jgi:glycosyltransferase involved in cell wall biosynthesis
VVAGRGATPAFQRSLSEPDVVFAGEVPEMAAEIAAATLCVVPLRIGSGTRLKIIEAAGMEKATVSTSIGAEGLEFVDGTEIALADTPKAFAQSTARLLNDPERRAQMGRAARVRAVEQYSIAALQSALRTALAPACNEDEQNPAHEHLAQATPLR